jgi:hypothetical protein
MRVPENWSRPDTSARTGAQISVVGSLLIVRALHSSLLLPPTAQRLIKLNERQMLIELGLHQV